MKPEEILQKEMNAVVIPLEKRCYSVEEVQEILGISRPSVYNLISKKEFRCVRVGGKYRISKKSFDEWLDNNI